MGRAAQVSQMWRMVDGWPPHEDDAIGFPEVDAGLKTYTEVCAELAARDFVAFSDVEPLIDGYRCAGNGGGGSLHIVLDDPNCDDKDIEWCIAWAIEDGDASGEALARVLLRVPEAERWAGLWPSYRLQADGTREAGPDV